MVSEGKGIAQTIRHEDGRPRAFQRFADVERDERLIL
jgi:hypothetical protein